MRMSDLAIALSSALLGAAAAGGFSVLLKLWERRTRRRVAAMVVLGDISVAEAAFALLIERREWFRHDFGPAISTWSEYRADFAAGVEIWEWAAVDAFYSNLLRSSAIARPGEAATDADIRVAEAMIEYAKEAWAVAIDRVASSKAERKRVIERLADEKDRQD